MLDSVSILSLIGSITAEKREIKKNKQQTENARMKQSGGE